LRRYLTSGAVLAVLLLSLLATRLGPAQAQAPTPIATISGTVMPGESQEHPFTIPQDLDEYLFYAQSQGAATADDTFDVTIDETGDSWWSLQGQQWLRGMALDAGDYILLVEAYPDATGPITYTVNFYSIPAVPVTFSGLRLATSSYDSAELSADFPADGNYTFTFGVQGASYEFLLDSESLTIVEGPGSVSAEVSEGRHQLDVVSQEAEQETSWSVTIQGPVSMSQTTSVTETTSVSETTTVTETTSMTQTTSVSETQPQLVVSIEPSCPTLNESAGQFNCILAAQATASDGGSPDVSYEWSSTGGSFNSTSGQWVNWTAPEINEAENFTLSVVASASGYSDGVASTAIAVQPIPEFEALPMSCLFLALGAACLIGRRRPPKAASRPID